MNNPLRHKDFANLVAIASFCIGCILIYTIQLHHEPYWLKQTARHAFQLITSADLTDLQAMNRRGDDGVGALERVEVAIQLFGLNVASFFSILAAGFAARSAARCAGAL